MIYDKCKIEVKICYGFDIRDIIQIQRKRITGWVGIVSGKSARGCFSGTSLFVDFPLFRDSNLFEYLFQYADEQCFIRYAAVFSRNAEVVQNKQ